MDDQRQRKRKSRWMDSDNPEVVNPIQDIDSLERPGLGFACSSKKVPEVLTAQAVSSTETDFMRQIREATERAKKIAAGVSTTLAGSSASTSLSGVSPVKKIKIPHITDTMTEAQKKQYNEQKELQEIYDLMMAKRNDVQKYAAELRRTNKFEYDSDEECEDGTWEHKLRRAEMEATKNWAVKMTEMADEKHHIGDFLPPDELKKFMETYQALKEGRKPNHSDYKEFKINAENIGFKLLKKLGWEEGTGLGKSGQGIQEPVNKSSTSLQNTGLGLGTEDAPAQGDSNYEMYRKRMMLAYKFRPNPLNNPRRNYY